MYSSVTIFVEFSVLKSINIQNLLAKCIVICVIDAKLTVNILMVPHERGSIYIDIGNITTYIFLQFDIKRVVNAVTKAYHVVIKK